MSSQINAFRLFCRTWVRKGVIPLEIECLRNGTLDVSLESGKVTGKHGPIKTRNNNKGYESFSLHRSKEGRSRKRTVLVHRLVKAKAIAFAVGGKEWRKWVKPLPRCVDVEHLNAKKWDNRNLNLELQDYGTNRPRVHMTEKEREQIYDFLATL